MEKLTDPAAEREPDRVTPRCGHLPQDDCECFGNDQPSAAAIEATEAARCCDPGPFCDDQPGCELVTKREPEHVTPKPADLDRKARAHADALAWLFGQTSAGWPGTDPAPVEPKSEVIHFDAGRADQHAACGYDLDRNGPEGWTTDRAKVTCAPCAATLVDEQLAPDPITPEVYAEHFPERDDAGKPLSVEPERRTVSLEVLTDKLFAEETDRRREEANGLRFDRLPTDSRVAVVLRSNGDLAAIIASDDPECDGPPPIAMYRLLRVAYDASRSVMDPDLGGELLMPTPDVLAALDGRPNAQLLTAPVWILAMDVTPGMLLTPESAAPQRLVTETPKCTDPECVYGSCAVFVVDELPGELHQSGYARTRVRIPAEVTR